MITRLVIRHHPQLAFTALAATGAALPRTTGRHVLVASAAGFTAMAARAGRPVTSFTPALTALAAGAGAAFYLATAHHGYHAAKNRSHQ